MDDEVYDRIVNSSGWEINEFGRQETLIVEQMAMTIYESKAE